MACPSLHLSKYHIVGNHMSWPIFKKAPRVSAYTEMRVLQHNNYVT